MMIVQYTNTTNVEHYTNIPTRMLQINTITSMWQIFAAHNVPGNITINSPGSHQRCIWFQAVCR